MPSLLLVEDDGLIQRMYQTTFAGGGFEVTVAGNGADALTRVEERQTNASSPFDVIVLDLMMPGMSGLDFLNNFVQQTGTTTKVVALSHIDNPVVVDKMMKAGAVEYLRKADYNPQALLEHVKGLLTAGSGNARSGAGMPTHA